MTETCEKCDNHKEWHPTRFWNNGILAYETCKKFVPKECDACLDINQDCCKNHSPRLVGDGIEGVPNSKLPSNEGSFNLSKESRILMGIQKNKIVSVPAIPTLKVKEAVKRLKEHFCRCHLVCLTNVKCVNCEEIDAIFGEDLI